MLAGYARVSTLNQNPELQLDALSQAECKRIFEDRASSGRSDRPGLAETLGWTLNLIVILQDAAFMRCGPIWCSWIGSKSESRVRNPTASTGSSDPVSLTSCPHVVLRPNRTANRAHPTFTPSGACQQSSAFKTNSSFPGSHAAASATTAGAR